MLTRAEVAAAWARFSKMASYWPAGIIDRARAASKPRRSPLSQLVGDRRQASVGDAVDERPMARETDEDRDVEYFVRADGAGPGLGPFHVIEQRADRIG